MIEYENGNAQRHYIVKDSPHTQKTYVLEYFLAYQELLPLSVCMINDILLKNIFIRTILI